VRIVGDVRIGENSSVGAADGHPGRRGHPDSDRPRARA
jgi:hypothetical protein